MRRAILLLALCALISRAPELFAGAAQGSGKEPLVTMNFDNVDIATVAKFISAITGKNLLLDDTVRGKVSVIAPARVTPAQAYCIFMSALQLKGFAAVRAGPVIEIMPARDARTFAPLTGSQTPAGECAQPVDPNA
jgi:general secretion pathway protein D